MNNLTYIEVEKLKPFENHPYYVKDDDEMMDLTESIKENGILSPLIVRPIENNECEVISGHRRLHAGIKAGMDKVPVLIYEMDRAAAAIALVDSNLHRDNVLPSERAFAYKLKMEALSHQGKRTDLTSAQVEPKLSTEIIGESENVSRETVCHPSKNRHKKAPKNEMNRSISLIYANRPHLFHGLLDNESLPV